MKKILCVLFIILSFFSCKNIQKTNKNENVSRNSYILINNKIIEKEISNYRKSILSDLPLEDGDSTYVGVFIKDINDSITRYIIKPIISINDIQNFPPHLICNIKGHDTFFFFIAGYSYSNDKDFFKLTNESFWKIVKRYFPKAYRTYKETGHFHAYRIYKPKFCYLTFINDTLVNKTLEYGNIRSKIKIRINDKEMKNKIYLW